MRYTNKEAEMILQIEDLAKEYHAATDIPSKRIVYSNIIKLRIKLSLIKTQEKCVDFMDLSELKDNSSNFLN